MNKLYSVHDHWTDINKKNDVDIESIDGVITGIKVNGEDYGGGKTWNMVFEGNVTTVGGDGGNLGLISHVSLNDTDSIKVTFNGTEYICEKQLVDGMTVYGGTANKETGKIDFSEYPFFIYNEEPSGITVNTETAGTYTLKIEEEQSGGSSDFSTARVTINNPNGSNGVAIPYLRDGVIRPLSDEDAFGETFEIVVPLGSNGTIVRPLSGSFVSTSGNITQNGNDYIITGDCTITIS